MAPVDIRPPGYIPQGTFSGTIPGEKSIERRRRLAEVLAEQGTSTAPVQHWTQGAARVAQSLAGVLGNYQANQMEQQRTSALAEALRSGMTPEQLFATGDEQLMGIAKFKAEQEANRIQAERQQATLDLLQRQDAREAAAAAQKTQPQFRPLTPEEQQQYPHADYIDPIQGPHYPPAQAGAVPKDYHEIERQKQAAKGEAKRAERAQAAEEFKAGITAQKEKLGHYDYGVDAQGKPTQAWVPNPGADDIFGPYQSGPLGRGIGEFFGTEAEDARAQWESDMAGLEEYAARMKGKGIVGRTLPSLRTGNARAAYDMLTARQAEADRIISGADNPEAPTAPPPQHPIQNATPVQPNTRAGEVPLPAQAAPAPQGGNLPFEPDPRFPRITPEVWATWPIEKQIQWKRMR